MTEKLVAAVPLKVTLVVPLNPLPMIVTSLPTGPLFGVNEVMLGAVGVTDAVSITNSGEFVPSFEL